MPKRGPRPTKRSSRAASRRQEMTADDATLTIRRATERLRNQLEHLPVIKVVGMSGAGKSTLVRRLRAAGYNARAVSQEHSNVPELWLHFDRPLVLIYLTLGLGEQRSRRSDVTWTPAYYRIEEERLKSARNNADVRVDTSNLTPDEVYTIALAYLRRANLRRSDHPLQPLPSTGSASRRGPGTKATESQT